MQKKIKTCHKHSKATSKKSFLRTVGYNTYNKILKFNVELENYLKTIYREFKS